MKLKSLVIGVTILVVVFATLAGYLFGLALAVL